MAARADPDQPARLVTLPVSWEDEAADALAALVPGDGAVNLAAASSVWVTMVESRARQAGHDEGIAVALHHLLRQRQAAPNAAVWRCEAGVPGFSLNAAGFYSVPDGFKAVNFAEAARLVAQACRLISPGAPRYEIGLSGLDHLLGCLGIPYDSRAARHVGACLSALMRGCVEHALEGEQGDLLAAGAAWPPPPRSCAIPGLAEAAALARARVCRAPGAIAATGVFAPGPQEALLGIETGGIAPAFSPVRNRLLTRAAQDRLAAAGMSPEAALAAVLSGETPLPSPGAQAHEAMRQAIAPYLEWMPEMPASLPAPALAAPAAAQQGGGLPERLPSRHAGLTQKVSVGGHRVFLRTAEYADGRLGEITLSLPRETASVRGLAECFAQAVSLGLQQGVRLEEFVEAFALTRFGPSGTVEGDPDVDRATSVLDYVFRTLSATYLGRVLPEAPAEQEAGGSERATPLLPLDLPEARVRRRRLQLVA